MRGRSGAVLILAVVSLTALRAGDPKSDFTWNAAMIWPGLKESRIAFFSSTTEGQPARHVHLMHLDGVRPDLLRSMLEHHQLPHIALLLSRGRISLRTSTVDKSETMKVIQSYLTSRWDTRVVGWWQFDRSTLRFRNFWMDPLGVLQFALGLEFPRYPTLFDILAADGRSVVAGFSLHRRSVPFRHYARAYRSGMEAVSRHTYLEQAHRTISSLLEVMGRMVARHEPLPELSTSLLAPVDEFGHFLGIGAQPAASPSELRLEVFERDDPTVQMVFRLLDEDRRRGGWILPLNARARMFEDLRWRGGRLERFSIRLPVLHLGRGSRARLCFAQPRVALALLLADLELGRLIQWLRRIHLEGGGYRLLPPPAGGIDRYLLSGRREGSLFEQTRFFLFGDHGMVETRHALAARPPEPGVERSPASVRFDFIQVLNRRLGLQTPESGRVLPTSAGQKIGVDDAHLPLDLKAPHQVRSWQSREAALLTGRALQWSHRFFQETKEALRARLDQRYWWLFFLRGFLLERRLDQAVEPRRRAALAQLSRLYLLSEPRYLEEERRALGTFFDRHVRLVYGGSARDNAELFLPGRGPGGLTWRRRPSLGEVLAYRPGPSRGQSLIDVLRSLPAVGLIFIRKDNADLPRWGRRPRRMEILVLDRQGRRGWILVEQKSTWMQPLFAYRLETEGADPLGYLGPRGRKSPWRTFNEWNDWCLDAGTALHNVVAGMGSYLYSTNPAIGDLTLMHAAGWNFGGNAASHGGLERGEKLTFLLVSGGGIRPGTLMARARLGSREGQVVRLEAASLTQPTLLDLFPTVLHSLGYPAGAARRFAQSRFKSHLASWLERQKSALPARLESLAARQGALSRSSLEGLRQQLERLLAFLPSRPGRLPDFRHYRPVGNRLDLGRQEPP